MKENRDDKCKMSFTESIDAFEICETPYKFSYETYQIIGETDEIDKIIKICGYINLSADDVISTLSDSAANYVAIGFGFGDDCMADALKEAIDKLPIGVEDIYKLLFNIWIPRNMTPSINYLNSLTEFIKDLSQNIDVCWGCAYDESLSGQQVKVTLIAASRYINSNK